MAPPGGPSSGERSIQPGVRTRHDLVVPTILKPPQMHIVYLDRGGVRAGVGRAGVVESRGRGGQGERTGRGSGTALGPGSSMGP